MTDTQQLPNLSALNKEQIRQIVDNALDAIVVMDDKGLLVDWNSQAELVFGWSRQEVVGQLMADIIIPPQYREAHRRGLERYLNTGEKRIIDKRIEIIALRKDGDKFPVELTISPIELEEGIIFSAFIRDMTEYKRLESKYQTILESIEDGYYEVDLAGNFTFFTDVLCQILGYPKDELLGMNNRQYTNRENAKKLHQAFSQIHTTGQPIKDFVLEVSKKDGTTSYVETSISLLKDAEDQPVGFRGIARDVTGRREVEDTLAKRAAELETVAQVATAASTTLETDKLLQGVVDLTKERFGLYHAHIYLLNIVGDTLDLAAGAGEVGRKMVAQGWRISFAREQSLVAQAARRKKGIIVNDVQADPNFFPNPLLPNTRSEMAVPMLVGDRVLGVLDVQADAVDHFTDEDVYIQTILAVQVATALENARLFEQTHVALADAEILAREQTALNELGQMLTAQLSVDQVLEDAYQQASRLIDTSNFYIGLYDQEKEEITFHLTISDSEIDQEITVISVTQGIAGYIVRNKTSLLFEDNVKARQEAIGIELVGEDAQSFLGVPLMTGDRVLGVMAVQTFTTPGLYDEHSRELMSAIGSQVSIALQNAHLFEESHKMTSEIEAQAKRLALLSDLGPELNRAANLNEVYRLVADKTNVIMEGSRAGIVLISPTDKALELYALDGLKGAIPMGTQLPLEGTMVGKVIQENWLIITSDIRDSEFLDHRQLVQQGLLSTMSVPLEASGQVIGSLNVGSKKQDAYAKRDENLMTQIASLLSSTIESRRLFEQMEIALEEAKTLRHLADQSYQASADLNIAQNYDDILAVLRRRTILGQGAQNISLNYFDHPWAEDQTPEWINVLARWTQLPTESVSPRDPIAAFSSVTKLLRADAPTLIEDVASDPRLDDNARALYTQRFGAKSAIFVPMVVGGQWIGYVNGIYQQITEFQGPDVRRLMSLVGQAAVVVQAIRRLEETERLARRERLLYEMGATMRKSLDVENILKIGLQTIGRELDRTGIAVHLEN